MFMHICLHLDDSSFPGSRPIGPISWLKVFWLLGHNSSL